MTNYKIRLYDPIIGSQEKKYVLDCLSSKWISSKGKYINKFENKFAKFIKIKHAISVVNGTSALHLALLALDINKNHEVIVPSFTYIAPVNAIKYVGANVRFIDSKLSTWQIDETKLLRTINKKTKAIIVPHLYGQINEIKKIKSICKKKKIFLIEDCAEAFGCYYKKKHLGTFGDVSTFSFFGSKTITTGEGGMVVTNNKKIAEKIYALKTQGVDPNKNYWHNIIGYNFRMTNICAAIGLAQLNNVKNILKNKIRVFKTYKKYLNKSILNFNHEIKNTKSSFWIITIFVKNKNYRNKLIKKLKKNKIETRTTFNPVHKMPMYYNKNYKKLLPNAVILSETGICLPSGPELKENQIKKICSLINSFIL
jgi:perosamine synthetase